MAKKEVEKFVLVATPDGFLHQLPAKEDTYEQMRELLGGAWLEDVPAASLRRKGIHVIVDEEGVLKGLPPCMYCEGFELYGKVIFCGLRKDGEFGGLTKEKVQHVFDRLF